MHAQESKQTNIKANNQPFTHFPSVRSWGWGCKCKSPALRLLSWDSVIVTTIQRSVRRTIQTFCQNPILPPVFTVHAMPMSDVQEHHQLESKYWVGNIWVWRWLFVHHCVHQRWKVWIHTMKVSRKVTCFIVYCFSNDRNYVTVTFCSCTNV